MKTAFYDKFQTTTTSSILRSLSIGLAGLFLTGSALTFANAADETFIDSANSPVVIDWPGNHIAVPIEV